MKFRPRTAAPLPWYRHPLVWLIIAFPALSVAGGLTTLWIATSTFDGLVVEDYYRKGMEINRRLERDRAAERYGLAASLEMTVPGEPMVITLHAAPDFDPPAELRVRFLHRTRGGFDQEQLFRRQRDLLYIAPQPDLHAGNWHVLIESGDWRLLESLRLP